MTQFFLSNLYIVSPSSEYFKVLYLCIHRKLTRVVSRMKKVQMRSRLRRPMTHLCQCKQTSLGLVMAFHLPHLPLGPQKMFVTPSWVSCLASPLLKSYVIYISDMLPGCTSRFPSPPPPCFTSLRIHLGIRRSPKKIFMKPSYDTYMTPNLILSHNQAKTLLFSAWYWLLEFYWTLISLHIRPKPCLIIILPVQPYLSIQSWTYKLLLEYKLW